VIRPRLIRTPILEHGVDVVFECVAASSAIDLGLHLLRPTGMLVMVGSAGRQRVDWSLVWNRQLTIQGSVNSPGTMARVVEWLSDPAFPADGLVTHVYDLPDWRAALRTASAGPRSQAVKVTLRANHQIPLVG
jgi:threonine dehydrogenase-like Zn-dependent dehydrogenase